MSSRLGALFFLLPVIKFISFLLSCHTPLVVLILSNFKPQFKILNVCTYNYKIKKPTFLMISNTKKAFIFFILWVEFLSVNLKLRPVERTYMDFLPVPVSSARYLRPVIYGSSGEHNF